MTEARETTGDARERSVRFIVSRVTIDMRDYEPMDRVVGPNGQEWRDHLYNLHTEADVLDHWAYNAAANGVTDVSQLDGWADVPPGVVTFSVERDDA